MNTLTVMLDPALVACVTVAGVGGVGSPARLVLAVGVTAAVRPEEHPGFIKTVEFPPYPTQPFQLECVHSLMSLQPTLPWKFS